MYHLGFISLFSSFAICAVLSYRKCDEKTRKAVMFVCFTFCTLNLFELLGKTSTILGFNIEIDLFTISPNRHVNVNNYVRCRPINTSFAPKSFFGGIYLQQLALKCILNCYKNETCFRHMRINVYQSHSFDGAVRIHKSHIWIIAPRASRWILFAVSFSLTPFHSL